MEYQVGTKHDSVSNPGVSFYIRKASFGLRKRIAQRHLDEVYPHSLSTKLRHTPECKQVPTQVKLKDDKGNLTGAEKEIQVYKCADYCPYITGEADVALSLDMALSDKLNMEEMLLKIEGFDIKDDTGGSATVLKDATSLAAKIIEFAPEDLVREIHASIRKELEPPDLKDSQSRGTITSATGQRDTSAETVTPVSSGKPSEPVSNITQKV